MFNPRAKLLHHGDRVHKWLNGKKPEPILVEIAPTGFCNARCHWCSFKDKKSTEFIDYLVLYRSLDDLKALGLKAINWSGGGEPTIHPNYANFVRYAQDLGLKQGIFTNGYQPIPHEKAFSWIRISITDVGLARAKRPGVPFGIVLNQIPELSELEIDKLCLEAKNFGASYFQVRPALTGDYRTQPILTPPEFLRAHESTNFKVEITQYKYEEATKPKHYYECYGYNFVPSIDWNGCVSACLYRSLEDKYILGDLNIDSFSDIWDNIPRSVPVDMDCWNCCKNHEINKVLYDAKEVKAVDFI